MTFTIVIDPGHGGTDSGANGSFEGVTYLEKTMNLDISLKLRDFLLTVKPKLNIIMTRTEDIFMGVCAKGTVAKQHNADVFISNHNNATGNSGVCGALTLYPDANIQNFLGSKVFAEFVQQNMVGYLNNQGWNMVDRGIANFRTNLGVFRCSQPIPACLTETAFMTCPFDMGKLRQEEFRADSAYGMALGIVAYLNETKNAGLSQPLREPVVPEEPEPPKPVPVPTEPNILLPVLLAGGLSFGLAYFFLIRRR